MDDLARWLTAQLDTDAARAQAASDETEPEWSDGGPYGETVHSVPHGGAVAVGPWTGYLTDAVRAHIAEHDPARVLREIEAKRSLVAAYVDALTVGPDVEGGYKRPIREALARQARDFLLVLALPYVDRPGFAEAVASAE